MRAHISNSVFDANTYKKVFEEADKVYLSTKTTEVSAGVAAVSLGAQKAGDEGGAVAAVKKNNKPFRNNRNNKGNGQSNGSGQSNNSGSNKNQNSQTSGTRTGGRGKRHSSNPPSSCCDNHYRWGADSWFCLEPLSCPWVSKVSAKPAENNK